MNLQLVNITKEFKEKKAVDKVNLNLTPGIWGLLGANGAGKTTLMRMIVDIMQPTAGAIKYNGENIKKLGNNYRQVLGFLPQEFGCSSDFSVVDYLEYVAAYKGIEKRKIKKKINELLDILTLGEVRKKKIVKLSGGMRRRVGIAQAMLNDPEILILDEPTAGLDPGERIRFRNFISEFAQKRIVLISTHIVSDIEYISAQNAIMKNGKIVDVGTTDELVKQIKGKVWSGLVPSKEIAAYETKLRIINQRNEANNMISIRYLSETPELNNSVCEEARLEDLYLWLFPEAAYEREVIK